MNYFESELFQISLGLFVFLAFYGFAIFLFRNQIKNNISRQSTERKLKISNGFPRLIKFMKPLLWIIPVYLVIKIILYLTVKPLLTEIDIFDLTLLTIGYFGFLIVFFFFKMLLDAVGKESEKE